MKIESRWIRDGENFDYCPLAQDMSVGWVECRKGSSYFTFVVFPYGVVTKSHQFSTLEEAKFHIEESFQKWVLTPP